MALITQAACGEGSPERASEAQSPRSVTYEQFVELDLGAARGTVERSLGPPAKTWSDPSRGTCDGWERGDRQPTANKPAFIACFQAGRLTSTSILDPDASD